jgi:hypothetical protein
MIEGILLVNLDPPYIGFSQASQDAQPSATRIDVWRDCSVDEIRLLLIDLNAFSPDQSWPPQECVLRLPINWTKAELTRLNLLTLCAIEPLPYVDIDAPALRRIS